jgi:hypothetical protein
MSRLRTQPPAGSAWHRSPAPAAGSLGVGVQAGGAHPHRPSKVAASISPVA